MCQPSVIIRFNGTICKGRFCTVSMLFVIDIAVLDSAVSLLISCITAGCPIRGKVCITFALIVEEDASKTNTNTSSDGLAG
jgi:hypothetical protein